jgi:hypothetical protein
VTNLEQMRSAWDGYAASYDEAIIPFSMRVAEEVATNVGIGVK